MEGESTPCNSINGHDIGRNESVPRFNNIHKIFDNDNILESFQNVENQLPRDLAENDYGKKIDIFFSSAA